MGHRRKSGRLRRAALPCRRPAQRRRSGSSAGHGADDAKWGGEEDQDETRDTLQLHHPHGEHQDQHQREQLEDGQVGFKGSAESASPRSRVEQRDLLLDRLEKIASEPAPRHMAQSDVANMEGLNGKKLKARFREQFGSPIYAFLQRARLDRARTLIEGGNLGVTEARSRSATPTPAISPGCFGASSGSRRARRTAGPAREFEACGPAAPAPARSQSFLKAGTIIGVLARGSGMTTQDTPKTASISPPVTISAGLPRAWIVPSFITTR